jgi:hypothetical protein
MKGAVVLAVVVAAAAQVAAAQTATGGDPRLTRPGWEAGVQGSQYHYEEPDFAKLVGAYNFTDERHWFSRIDGRVAYGKLKYEGSGTMNDVPNWIGEIRAVAGKDFLFGETLALSPYAGFGYRYLYNDLRGYTSTGAAGYRRYSNYTYAPIGLTMRLAMGGRFVIAPTVEYDAFLQGRQQTKLADTGIAGVQNVSNDQSKGYGYRAYLMFEYGHLAFGPWLHYWSIKDSEVSSTGLFEPANWTREWGGEIRYRF